MIIMLAASLLATQQANTKDIVCPMTAETVAISFANVDFAGARFEMCCGGCPEAFKKDPATALKNEKLKGKVAGMFLFDPVSGKRIEPKDAKGGFSDYKGLRYFFAASDEKKKFDAEPKSFVKKTSKEVLSCAVSGEAIKNYATAGGYVDYEGTRYYTCCPDCLVELKKDPAKFAAKASEKAKAPTAMDAPKDK